MKTKIYKGIDIFDCEYNDAIIECIREINSHSKTGSHELYMSYNLIPEHIRIELIKKLRDKIKKPNVTQLINKGFGNIQEWLNQKWLHFEVNEKYGYISPVVLYKQINNIKT